MSEPIKVGDLVQVVHSCCGKQAEHGLFGAIRSVVSLHRDATRCQFCDWHATNVDFADLEGDDYAPVSWLKRIPPFPELKDERHDEEIAA